MNIPTSGVGDSLLLANIDGFSNTLQTATGMGVTVNITRLRRFLSGCQVLDSRFRHRSDEQEETVLTVSS